MVWDWTHTHTHTFRQTDKHGAENGTQNTDCAPFSQVDDNSNVRIRVHNSCVWLKDGTNEKIGTILSRRGAVAGANVQLQVQPRSVHGSSATIEGKGGEGGDMSIDLAATWTSQLIPVAIPNPGCSDGVD